MDPLTHALAGAAVGALAAREERMRSAMLAGALAALAPDLDVLVRSEADPLLQLEVHRQYTHSLLVAPLIGLLVAAAVAALGRVTRRSDVRWPALALPASLGAVSACLLDAGTSYGTRLAWPLVDDRVAFNAVAVIDPVVTVVLLAAVAVSLWRASTGVAWAGTALVAVYLVNGATQHDSAAFAVRSLAAERGHVIEALQVKPTLGNQVLWRSVYRAGGRYHVDGVRVGWFARSVIYPGASIAVLDAGETGELDAAARRDIERFSRASSGWVVRHPRHDDVVGDIRYSMNPDSVEPLWGIEVGGEAGTRWRNFRERAPEAGERFLAMLLGEALDRRPENRTEAASDE